MRKLASVQTIRNIQAAPNSDSLSIATINNWQCVVKRDQFVEGETVLFFETDSFLPIHPTYDFLRKSSLKKMELDNGDIIEGFRIKTVKLRGNMSQGLILPITDLYSLLDYDCNLFLNVISDIQSMAYDYVDDTLYNKYITLYHLYGKFLEMHTAYVKDLINHLQIGTDLTNLLNVKLYRKKIPVEMLAKAKGDIPYFVKSTTVDRLQTLTLDHLQNRRFVITEKIDGCSVSFYKFNNEFGICSRSWELYPDDDNFYTKVANAYNLAELLPNSYVLQCEVIGKGSENDPFNTELDIVAFNAIEISTMRNLSFDELNALLFSIDEGLMRVPIITWNYTIDSQEKIDALFTMADFRSKFDGTVRAEGLVLHEIGTDYKVKVISKQYEMDSE